MKSLLLAILGFALVAGCATQPQPNLTRSEAAKVEWNGRVGKYTYDQALADLGRPDVLNESSDGRSAEWVLTRSPQTSFGIGVGGGYSGRPSSAGVGVATAIAPPPSGEYLRLQFGAENQLKAWSKVRY